MTASAEREFYVLFSLSLAGLVICFYLINSSDSQYYGKTVFETSEILESKGGKYLNESCYVAFGKPLDQTLLRFIDPNSTFKCEKKYSIETDLNDGFLDIIEDSFNKMGQWSYRCIHLVTNHKIRADKWIHILKPRRTPISCDVIEVKAELNGARTYGFVHAQVVPRSDTRLKASEAPSVHIIVLDTVSTPNFVRSMKKTYEVLSEEYKGMLFPHLNKIGRGSSHNSLAIMFGQQPVDVEESIWGPFKPKEEGPRDFILYEYQRKNYRTFFAEDCGISITWAEQKEPFKAPDHGLSSYGRRIGYISRSNKDLFYYDQNRSSEWFSEHIEGHCEQPHKPLMKSFEKFINVYKDEAQFSAQWFTGLAHEDLNALYSVDEEFAEFLRRNKEILDNSFVFILGDHGPRHGVIRDRIAGQFEDNNPMLLMTLPKSLRSEENFERIMQENSKLLVTQYDVHATFTDILKNHLSLNTTLNPFQVDHRPAEHGSSLLRRLPQPRNCNSLHIPLLYCMCKKIIKEEHNSSLALRIARQTVDDANAHFMVNNLLADCVLLKLNEAEPIELVEYNVRGLRGEKLVHVLFSTFPGNIKFTTDAYINPIDQSITMIKKELYRVTKYTKEELTYRNHFKSAPNSTDFCYPKQLALILDRKT